MIQGISGVANSTGNPTGYYGWFLPSFMTHVPDFGVLDFRYMLYAMDICEEGVNLELTQNVYLRHCDTGFKFNADDVTLEVSHPYACDVTTLFDDDGHSGSYYSPYDPPDTADCDGDYDNDGMDDGWEVRNMGSTSQGPTGDYDQDGLTNLQEYQLGTNPGNSDSDGDGLPDGWEYNWFGNFAHTGSELDAARNTLLYDYQNYLDPNGIAFSIEVANSHVNTSNPNLQLEVFAGVPSYVAVLVDNTNFASASWAAHTSSTITANLGSTQGWHDVWVGLKGWAANAGVAWQLKRLKLDTSPPQLTITSPASSTVDVSILQLAGYSQEALSSIRYDLENALVLVTNQLVLVTGQEFDRDAWENTTNYFEGVDILLTNGVNTITLHATDLAGNLAALVTNFTLDYSGKTNLPVITLTWPTNDMHISGSSFTWDGFVTDPTATVTAQVTSDGGPTNTLSGMVERDGRFWVDDIPLSSGANALTLTVSDAMGNTSVTNISVVQSTLVLTVDPVPDPAELWQPTVDLVTGTISDSSMAVWVNGVKGTNHGNGTWSASNVPTTPGGVASFTVTAYESTDQQPDGSYGN